MPPEAVKMLKSWMLGKNDPTWNSYSIIALSEQSYNKLL